MGTIGDDLRDEGTRVLRVDDLNECWRGPNFAAAMKRAIRNHERGAERTTPSRWPGRRGGQGLATHDGARPFPSRRAQMQPHSEVPDVPGLLFLALQAGRNRGLTPAVRGQDEWPTGDMIGTNQ